MKVLLYKCENELAPIGGPFGYLYSIKKYRDDINDSELLFKEKDWKYNKSIIDKIVGHLVYPNSRSARNIYFTLSKRFPNKVEMLNKYDIVHFHSTEDMFRERKNLSKYNGIVVLTSHSPKVSYKDLF